MQCDTCRYGDWGGVCSVMHVDIGSVQCDACRYRDWGGLNFE